MSHQWMKNMEKMTKLEEEWEQQKLNDDYMKNNFPRLLEDLKNKPQPPCYDIPPRPPGLPKGLKPIPRESDIRKGIISGNTFTDEEFHYDIIPPPRPPRRLPEGWKRTPRESQTRNYTIPGATFTDEPLDDEEVAKMFREQELQEQEQEEVIRKKVVAGYMEAKAAYCNDFERLFFASHAASMRKAHGTRSPAHMRVVEATLKDILKPDHDDFTKNYKAWAAKEPVINKDCYCAAIVGGGGDDDDAPTNKNGVALVARQTIKKPVKPNSIPKKERPKKRRSKK